MRVAVLSPHRDDAAFSCGITVHAFLRAGADLTVVNVFTRSDYAVDLRTIDTTLPLVEGVSEARLLEDRSFLADLVASAHRNPGAVRLHDLAWLDAPLRLAVQTEQVLESPLDAEGVAEQASALAQELGMLSEYDIVFVPLALGDHIDHRIAREAARIRLKPEQICWYEDLPYAARMTSSDRDESSRRVMPSNSQTNPARYRLQVADALHLKKRFALHYPSQIAPAVADEMAVYATQWAKDGAERWFATASTAHRVQTALQGSGAVVSREEDWK